MKMRLITLLTAGVLGVIPSAALGRQSGGPPGTIRVRVRLVPVDVIATDDRDRPVTDLKATFRSRQWLRVSLNLKSRLCAPFPRLSFRRKLRALF